MWICNDISRISHLFFWLLSVVKTLFFATDYTDGHRLNRGNLYHLGKKNLRILSAYPTGINFNNVGWVTGLVLFGSAGGSTPFIDLFIQHIIVSYEKN
jgi:hypothetical protein